MPNWKTILSAKASRQFLVNELSSTTRVQIAVDAVIVRNRVIGLDLAGLAKTYRTTRKAERDEARDILKLLESGGSQAQIRAVVSQHASAPRPARDSNYTYNMVRIRQAGVLLRRLEKARPEQFAKTLNYITSESRPIHSGLKKISAGAF